MSSSTEQTKTPLPPFTPPKTKTKTNETRACEECGTHFTPEAWEIETPPKRAWLCGNDCLYAHICKMVPQ